jgi:hypothetical protein
MTPFWILGFDKNLTDKRGLSVEYLMDKANAQRRFLAIALFSFLLSLTSCAPGPYLIYSPDDSSFAPVPPSFVPPADIATALPPIPDSWEVVDAAFADVTGDGAPEWVLAVRRPWRDWPIIAWHGGTSPITGFKDREGKSSHLVVVGPAGDERWAGSALPRPIGAMAAGDIDGDTVAEVVTLEADYGDRIGRPARFIDVWKWDVFGFVLAHRSGEGSFEGLTLYDVDNDGILEIIIR